MHSACLLKSSLLAGSVLILNTLFSGCFSTSMLSQTSSQYYWEESRTSYAELEAMYSGKTVKVVLNNDSSMTGLLYRAGPDSIVLRDSTSDFRWSAPTAKVSCVRRFNHWIPTLVAVPPLLLAGGAIADFVNTVPAGNHPESAKSGQVLTGAAVGAALGFYFSQMIPYVYEYDIPSDSLKMFGTNR